MNGWRFEISRNKIILSHFNNDKKRIKFLIIFHSRCQCFRKKKSVRFFCTSELRSVLHLCRYSDLEIWKV